MFQLIWGELCHPLLPKCTHPWGDFPMKPKRTQLFGGVTRFSHEGSYPVSNMSWEEKFGRAVQTCLGEFCQEAPWILLFADSLFKLRLVARQ